ncbi:hypothetical protein [Thaumasiovibrio sp. DFM-14]|uniref:hypothetical protein n=1 Tax=Thaumasiovibrio sp. DFM-14 TaxID=3384792 RepID=UPI0039A3F6F4
MDINATLLRRIGAKLQQLVRDDAWDEVRKLDRQIHKLLLALKQQPDLAQSLKTELLTLKQIHLDAMTACEIEKTRVGQLLANYQQQREGVSAYHNVELGGGA